MSQHQQAFLTDDDIGVSQVARQALMLLAQSGEDRSLENMPVSPEQVIQRFQMLKQHFYEALALPDPIAMDAALEELKVQGLSDAAIANDLVPTAARQLGCDWEADLISFSGVTIGCSRLQSVIRRLVDFEPKNHSVVGKSALNFLIVSPESAQHTLGAIVLARQLRVAGSRVHVELGLSANALKKLAKEQQFDGVMISASRAESIECVRQLVVQCRQSWEKSKIFLGGGILENGNDLAATTGTDYVTNDWQEAVRFCT